MQSSHSIWKFYRKCLFIALPLLLLFIFYVVEDPFMVIRHYNDYDQSRVMQNEGAVGWEKYKMYRKRCHYDSFVLGTSCTKAFSCREWNRYIHAHPFRFFSNEEGLGECYMKLEALDKEHGQRIRHLLIITERSFFEKTHPRQSLMHIMPPDVSGESWAHYQTVFFQGFLSPKFLMPYMRYLVTGKPDTSGRDVIHSYVPTRDRYTNDALLPQDAAMAKEGESYWKNLSWRRKIAKTRVHEGKQVIGEEQVRVLQEIRRICDLHHTDVHWVVGPSFHLERFNHHDLKDLQQLFGKHAVHDESASPRFHDYHDFYDPSHYRRRVGDAILKDIYQSPV